MASMPWPVLNIRCTCVVQKPSPIWVDFSQKQPKIAKTFRAHSEEPFDFKDLKKICIPCNYPVNKSFFGLSSMSYIFFGAHGWEYRQCKHLVLVMRKHIVLVMHVLGTILSAGELISGSGHTRFPPLLVILASC